MRLLWIPVAVVALYFLFWNWPNVVIDGFIYTAGAVFIFGVIATGYQILQAGWDEDYLPWWRGWRLHLSRTSNTESSHK